MYRIETHLHTHYISACGQMSAEELAAAYHAAGYDGIAVTDHYNIETFDMLGLTPRETPAFAARFLEGYERMCAACAPYGIRVYLGAELRFYENQNDYLLFGFEPSLLDPPDELMSMGVAAFSQKAREAGALFIQAHPFRPGCVPVAAMLLDGIEIYNGNPRHNSRDALAQAYAAREPGFICTAGSDCHQPQDVAASGILTETLPEDSRAFAELLRARAFTPILPGRTET